MSPNIVDFQSGCKPDKGVLNSLQYSQKTFDNIYYPHILPSKLCSRKCLILNGKTFGMAALSFVFAVSLDDTALASHVPGGFPDGLSGLPEMSFLVFRLKACS